MRTPTVPTLLTPGKIAENWGCLCSVFIRPFHAAAYPAGGKGGHPALVRSKRAGHYFATK